MRVNDKTDNLSESALRFAKANTGMYIAKPKIKQTKQMKLDVIKDKAIKERPTTKLNQSKILCKLHKDESRKQVISMLVDKLGLSYATASVYACICNKMIKSELPG